MTKPAATGPFTEEADMDKSAATGPSDAGTIEIVSAVSGSAVASSSDGEAPEIVDSVPVPTITKSVTTKTRRRLLLGLVADSDDCH